MSDNRIKDDTVDLKQRIVGAIVIVSLAVIILPILLRPEENSKQHFSTERIPPIPAEVISTVSNYNKVTKKTEAMPALPTVNAIPIDKQNKQQVEQSVVKIARDVAYKNADKAADKLINQAYTIQLGSFSQQQNAFKLRDKLRDKKFKAYIEKVNLNAGISYRVRVGPYLKHPTAVTKQKNIKRKFNIEGSIVIYK
ncbi:MAG: SPOR domain-containing protein [Pseudomonadota bacterium]